MIDMSRFSKLLLILTALLNFFSSCVEDPEVEIKQPSIELHDAKEITHDSAILSADIDFSDIDIVESIGFKFGTAEEFTAGRMRTIFSEIIGGVIICKLDNLEKNTKYMFSAFASNGITRLETAPKIFTTLKEGNPDISIKEVDGFITATILDNAGNDNFEVLGFCCSKNVNMPTVENCDKSISVTTVTEDNFFRVSISELPQENLFIRAFAKTKENRFYYSDNVVQHDLQILEVDTDSVNLLGLDTFFRILVKSNADYNISIDTESYWIHLVNSNYKNDKAEIFSVDSENSSDEGLKEDYLKFSTSENLTSKERIGHIFLENKVQGIIRDITIIQGKAEKVNITSIDCQHIRENDLNEFTLFLKESSGESIGEIVINVPMDNNYLCSGVYKYGKGINTFTIKNFYINNQKPELVHFIDGTLNVELDKIEYSLTCKIIDNQGRVFKLVFKGSILEMFKRDLTLMDITNAELLFHHKHNAMIRFFFEGDEYILDLFMNFPLTESTNLPRGMYKVSYLPYGERKEFTINASESKLDDLVLDESQYLKADVGNVSVSADDVQWIIGFEGLETRAGLVIDKVFNGKIEGLAISDNEPANVEYSSLTFKSYEQVHVPDSGYKLTFEGNNKVTDSVDTLTFTFKCEDKYLTSGTYSLNDGSLIDPTIISSSSSESGTFTPDEAQAIVSLDDNLYTIHLSWLNSQENAIYEGTWVGEIQGMFGPIVDSEINDLNLISMQRTSSPKGFTLNFESKSLGLGMTYTIRSDEKYLLSGHYSLLQGTLISPTYIEDFLSPWGGPFVPKDATLDIISEEFPQTYTILLKWEDDSGRIIGGCWSGMIDGMFSTNWTFSRAEAAHWGDEALITLYTDDSYEEDIKLLLFFPYQKDKKHIPQEQFSPGNGYDEYSVRPKYCLHEYSNLKNKSTQSEDYFTPREGSIIVSSDGEKWVIRILDVKTESGKVINATYKGPINNLASPY